MARMSTVVGTVRKDVLMIRMVVMRDRHALSWWQTVRFYAGMARPMFIMKIRRAPCVPEEE